MFRRAREPLPEPPLDRDDVLTIMGALADIRADPAAIRALLEEHGGEDGMTPEERSERDARRAKVDRLLAERIAYHEAKLEEERRAAAPPAARRRRLFRRD